LAAVYRQHGDLSDDDVARATRILEAAGGRERTLDEAGDRLGAALAAIDGVGLVPSACDELRGLARFVVDRRF
jgi:geranylgeranyl pyrophosphate synthase